MEVNYLKSARRQFEFYKLLGEQAIAQVPDDQLFWSFNESSNSIAIIVQHLHGNMLSRWTDFLSSDGEKENRNRDGEFESDITTKNELLERWNKGWNCLFDTLNMLEESDLSKEIFIRNQGHSVLEAINRQLAHYSYHVGQIVFLGKMICGDQWLSLSIPKGNSKSYNDVKFAQPKHTEHFTNEFLKKKSDDK